MNNFVFKTITLASSRNKTMEIAATYLDQVVNERRSIRAYTDEPVENEAVVRSIERALLAPNSSNLQLWEFYRVKSADKLKELATYCLGQKAATTAKEMLVVVVRRDHWKDHAHKILADSKSRFPENPGKREKLVVDYYSKVVPTMYSTDPLDVIGVGKKMLAHGVGLFRPVPREVAASDVRVIVHKSAALAAQTFMLSMKAEGYDTCPMEGFDSVRVKKMLHLPAAAEINMIISYGKARPDGIYGPRFRIPTSEVVFEI
jgi:nitroreductase